MKKVTPKFLNDLANKIYNPKTKKFLRLCDGVLLNGPDPKNPKRHMHCGLGELYFEMAGVHPPTWVDEEDVINTAMMQADFSGRSKAIEKKLFTQIEQLKAGEGTKLELESAIQDTLEADQDSREVNFHDALSEIPTENDDGCGDVCTAKAFRERSQRVAKALREAAKVLAE